MDDVDAAPTIVKNGLGVLLADMPVVATTVI